MGSQINESGQSTTELIVILSLVFTFLFFLKQSAELTHSWLKTAQLSKDTAQSVRVSKGRKIEWPQ